MFQVIDAACMLANVFDVCRERNEISLLQVRRLSEQVEVKVRPKNVMVDWTRPSVMSAFSFYGDLFVWVDDEARKSPQADDLLKSGFVENEFNFRLPPDIVAEMRAIIQSSLGTP